MVAKYNYFMLAFYTCIYFVCQSSMILLHFILVRIVWQSIFRLENRLPVKINFKFFKTFYLFIRININMVSSY
jgi:hypothetical protein